jgi:hypothetical protein
MPNTAALITDVQTELRRGPWRHSGQLKDLLDQAFSAFYPDGDDQGFTPEVVDFFSSLRSYIDICSGYRGGLPNTPELFRKLKFGIAQLLTRKLREKDYRLRSGSKYLDRVVQPGNIVVTSNWDVGIERCAWLKGVPIRFTGHRESELVILKLHGSIDWTSEEAMRGDTYADSEYAVLSEKVLDPETPGRRSYRRVLPSGDDRAGEVFRIRALEDWNSAWSTISSRTREPYIVTMARSKAGDLGPLAEVWQDAYEALSRAQRVEIVGYSMPDDDIEIRTLLRAAVRRGSGPGEVVVRNPSPDVHVRIRRFLRRAVQSNYLPVDAL